MHCSERAVNQIVELRAQEKLYEQHIHNVQAAKSCIDMSHPTQIPHMEKAQKFSQITRKNAFKKTDRLYAKIHKKPSRNNSANLKNRINNQSEPIHHYNLSLAEDYAITTRKNWIDEIRQKAIDGDQSKNENEIDFTSLKNQKNIQNSTSSKSKQTNNYRYRYFNNNCVYCFEATNDTNDVKKEKEEFEKKYPDPESISDPFLYNYSSDQSKGEFDAEINKEYVCGDKLIKDLVDQRLGRNKSLNSRRSNSSDINSKLNSNINDDDYIERKKVDNKYMKFNSHYRHETKSPTKLVVINHDLLNNQDDTSNTSNEFVFQKDDFYKFTSPPMISIPKAKNKKKNSYSQSNNFEIEEEEESNDDIDNINNKFGFKDNQYLLPQLNILSNYDGNKTLSDNKNVLQKFPYANNSTMQHNQSSPCTFKRKIVNNGEESKTNDDNENFDNQGKDFSHKGESNELSNFSSPVITSENKGNQNTLDLGLPTLNTITPIRNPQQSTYSAQEQSSLASNSLSPQSPIMIGSPMYLDPMKIFHEFQSTSNNSQSLQENNPIQTPNLKQNEAINDIQSANTPNLKLNDAESDSDPFSPMRKNIDLLISPDFLNKRTNINKDKNNDIDFTAEENKIKTKTKDKLNDNIQNDNLDNENSKDKNKIESKESHRENLSPNLQVNKPNENHNNEKENRPNGILIKSDDYRPKENQSNPEETPKPNKILIKTEKKNQDDKNTDQSQSNEDLSIPKEDEKSENLFNLDQSQPNEDMLIPKEYEKSEDLFNPNQNQQNEDLPIPKENKKIENLFNPKEDYENDNLFNQNQNQSIRKDNQSQPINQPISNNAAKTRNTSTLYDDSSSRLFYSSSSASEPKKQHKRQTDSKQQQKQGEDPQQNQAQNNSLSQQTNSPDKPTDIQNPHQEDSPNITNSPRSQLQQDPLSPMQLSMASSFVQKQEDQDQIFNRHHHHHHRNHTRTSRTDSPTSPKSRRKYEVEALQKLPTGELYSKDDRIEKPIKTVDEKGTPLPYEQTLSVRPHPPKRHISVPDHIPQTNKVVKKTEIPLLENMPGYEVPYGFVEVKDEERESYIAKRITKKRKRFKRKKGVPPTLEYKETKFENVEYKIYSKGENNQSKDEGDFNNVINDFNHSKEKKKNNKIYLRDILLFNNKEIDPKILEEELKRELQSDESTNSEADLIEEEEVKEALYENLDKVDDKVIDNNIIEFVEEEENLDESNESNNNDLADFTDNKISFAVSAPLSPINSLPPKNDNDKQFTQLIQNNINQLMNDEVNRNSTNETTDANSNCETSQTSSPKKGKRKNSKKPKKKLKNKKQNKENSNIKEEEKEPIKNNENDTHVEPNKNNENDTHVEPIKNNEYVNQMEPATATTTAKDKQKSDDEWQFFSSSSRSTRSKSKAVNSKTGVEMNQFESIDSKKDDKSKNNEVELIEEEEEVLDSSKSLLIVESMNPSLIDKGSHKNKEKEKQITDSAEADVDVDDNSKSKEAEEEKIESNEVVDDNKEISESNEVVDDIKEKSESNGIVDENKEKSEPNEVAEDNKEKSESNGIIDENKENQKDDSVVSKTNFNNSENKRDQNKDTNGSNDEQAIKGEVKDDNENEDKNTYNKNNVEESKEDKSNEDEDKKIKEKSVGEEEERKEIKSNENENENKEDKDENKEETILGDEEDRKEIQNKENKSENEGNKETKGNEGEISSEKDSTKEIQKAEDEERTDNEKEGIRNKKDNDETKSLSSPGDYKIKGDQIENKEKDTQNNNGGDQQETNSNEDEDKESEADYNDVEVKSDDENIKSSRKDQNSKEDEKNTDAESSNKEESKEAENSNREEEQSKETESGNKEKSKEAENSNREEKQSKEAESSNKEESKETENSNREEEQSKEAESSNKEEEQSSKVENKEEEQSTEVEINNKKSGRSEEGQKSCRKNKSDEEKSDIKDIRNKEDFQSTEVEIINDDEEDENKSSNKEIKSSQIENKDIDDEYKTNTDDKDNNSVKSIPQNNTDESDDGKSHPKSSSNNEQGTDGHHSSPQIKDAPDKEVESKDKTESDNEDDNQAPIVSQVAHRLLSEPKEAGSNELPTEVTISFELVNNNNQTKSSESDLKVNDRSSKNNTKQKSSIKNKNKSSKKKSIINDNIQTNVTNNIDDHTKIDDNINNNDQTNVSNRIKDNSTSSNAKAKKHNQKTKEEEDTIKNDDDDKKDSTKSYSNEPKSASSNKPKTASSNKHKKVSPNQSEIVYSNNEESEAGIGSKPEKERELTQPESNLEEEEEVNDYYSYYSYYDDLNDMTSNKPRQYEQLTESISESMRSNREKEEANRTNNNNKDEEEEIASSKEHVDTNINGEDEKASSEISNEESFHFEGENDQGQKFTKKRNKKHQNKKTKIIPPSNLPFKILSQSPSYSQSVSAPATSSPLHSNNVSTQKKRKSAKGSSRKSDHQQKPKNKASLTIATNMFTVSLSPQLKSENQKSNQITSEKKNKLCVQSFPLSIDSGSARSTNNQKNDDDNKNTQLDTKSLIPLCENDIDPLDDLYIPTSNRQHFFVLQNNLDDNVTIPPNSANEYQNSTNTEITHDQTELDSIKEPNSLSSTPTTPLKPPPTTQIPRKGKIKVNPHQKKKVFKDQDGIEVIGNSPLRQKRGNKLDEITDRFLKAKVVSPDSKNSDSDTNFAATNISLRPTPHKAQMTNSMYQRDFNDDELSPVANFSALAQMGYMNKIIRESTPQRFQGPNNVPQSPLASPTSSRRTPSQRRSDIRSKGGNTTVRWIK